MIERRATDPNQIDKMIADESDPKNRMFLLILNNINKSLVANTETIQAVSERLDDHLTRFEADSNAKADLLSQGKGAWKVAAWVIGAVQVAGLAVWVESRSEIAEIQLAVHADQIEHARIIQRVDTLEKTK